MEVTDDADVLLDLGNDDDDDTIGDSEQESSAHQIKRTKLTSEGPMSQVSWYSRYDIIEWHILITNSIPCNQGTSYPSRKFGWDSFDYVTDVECIIPKDQQRLLNNLPGKNFEMQYVDSSVPLLMFSRLDFLSWKWFPGESFTWRDIIYNGLLYTGFWWDGYSRRTSTRNGIVSRYHEEVHHLIL